MISTPSLFDMFDASPGVCPALPVEPVVFTFAEKEPERDFYLVFRLNQPGNPLLYDYTTMAEYAAFKNAWGQAPQAARWSYQLREGAALCCANKEKPDGTNEN